MHQHKKALAKIEQAIKLNPKAANYYYCRANINAAGGTSHRLKPGPAMVRSLANHPSPDAPAPVAAVPVAAIAISLSMNRFCWFFFIFGIAGVPRPPR